MSIQPGRRLYLGHVAPNAERADIEKYFGKYGALVDVRLMSGFAFVEYDRLRDAEDAVHDLNGRDFMGERLQVEYAKAPRARDPYGGPPGGGYGGGGGMGGPRRGGGYRLNVRGCSAETSWQDLKDFARTAGNVIRADVDRSTGDGIIEYSSAEDAENAARKLDNTDLKGSVVSVVLDRDGPSAGGGPPPPPPRDYDRGYGGGGGGSYDRRDRYDDRRDDRGGGYGARPRDRSRSPGARRPRSPPPAREYDYPSSRRERTPPRY